MSGKVYFIMSLVFVVCLNGAVQAETIDVNNFSFEYDVNGNPFTDPWYGNEALLQAWSVDANWGGTSGITSRDNSSASEGDYSVMGEAFGGSLYQVLPHAIAADKRYVLTFDAASWPGGSGDCRWAVYEAMSSIFYPDDGNFPDLNHVKLAGKTFSTLCSGTAGEADWAYNLALSYVADGNSAGKSLGISVGFPDPPEDDRYGLVDNVRVDTYAPEVAWGPRPADGASDVGQPVTLIWEAGDYAQDVNGHEVYLGTSFAEVNDADTTSIAYQGAPDVNSFATGPLAWAQTYYWRVDEVNSTTWEGDVWSFTVMPAAATTPNPGDGTWDISILTDLSWTAGAEVNTHEVYFSTDFNDVNDRSIGAVVESANSHSPGTLDFWTTYYWAVDEVNLAETPNMWPGSVWSFATMGFLSVDDFDSYANDNQLRVPWDDWRINSTGSEVWNETDPDFTRNGNSMQYDYDSKTKDGGTCVGSIASTDTTRLGIGSDWTASGMKGMVLYFYGDAGNSATAGDQLWLQLEDTSSVSGVVLYDDVNDLAVASWHEWNIDLNDANFSGVSLANIDKIHIGFGGPNAGGDCKAGSPGGTGTVRFDDIEVWPARCRPELVASDFDGNCKSDIWDLWLIGNRWLISEGNVPAESAPDTSAGGLLVRYEFEETSGTTASDSSGNGYDGTVSTASAWDANGYDGNCLDFTGLVDVQVPNSVWSFPMSEVTISVWVKAESLAVTNIYAPFGGGDDGTGAGGDWSDWWLLSMIYKSDWGDGTPGYEVNFRSSTQDSGAYDVITYQDPNTDGWQGWHHYAFVKNANRGVQSIYLDGEKVAENYWAADRLIEPIDPNHDSFAIGYSGSTEWGWGRFEGRMDDFRIYDHALSHGQIVDLAGKALVYQPYVGDDADIDANKDYTINFGDYAFMAEKWLQDPILWP